MATDHGASGGNTAMIGALMQTEILACPKRHMGRLPVTFAKKPKRIPKNMEILEAGAQAARVLQMAARKQGYL